MHIENGEGFLVKKVYTFSVMHSNHKTEFKYSIQVYT